jgi:hypothetical protein
MPVGTAAVVQLQQVSAAGLVPITASGGVIQAQQVSAAGLVPITCSGAVVQLQQVNGAGLLPILGAGGVVQTQQVSAAGTIASAGVTATVTVTGGEHIVGNIEVITSTKTVALVDTATGQGGDGRYTISVTSTGATVVTKGKPPAVSSTQINLASVTVTRNGANVQIRDLRNRQVSHDAVNAAIMHQPNADGSPIRDGMVTTRTLSSSVLAMIAGSGTKVLPFGSVLPTLSSANIAQFRGLFYMMQGDGSTTPDRIFVAREKADGTFVWSRFQGRAYTMALSGADFTPNPYGAGADAQGERRVKYDPDEPGVAITWTVSEIFFRLQTAANPGTTSLKIQRSTGPGPFVNTGYLNATSVDIPAGANQARMISGFSQNTVNSGDLLRSEFTALGTAGSGFTVEVTLRETA